MTDLSDTNLQKRLKSLSMRIVSWNVNAFKTISEIQGDLICVQEVKGRNVEVDGYIVYENKATTKGYSGVATIVSKDWIPFSVSDTLIVNGKKDDQGRFLMTDHRQFILINVYFPYSSDSDPVKLGYKAEFHYAITDLIQSLVYQSRSVIIVGDFNCTYDSKDSFYSDSPLEHIDCPWSNWFLSLMMEFSLVDTFRKVHPDTVSYTCWNTKLNSRAVNQGSRIDYILISSNLLEFLTFSNHLTEVQGSDHCPIIADLSILPIIHRDQLKFQNLQPSIKSFFPQDNTVQYYENTRLKKQRKVSDFFEKKSIQESSKESFTEVVQFSKKIKATINSKEKEDVVNKWDQLFTPKPPPNCYHKEPCKEFKTKVKGPNTGRIFYACARGGIAMSKSTSVTEDRCNYFQWKFGKKNNSYSKTL